MKRHVLSATVNLTLSILIVLFGCGGKEVAVGTPKEFEDVLDVIPADVVGFVYASSFQGLNDEINALARSWRQIIRRRKTSQWDW
jgi:hypothetical protein